MSDITPERVSTIALAKLQVLDLMVRFLLKEWANANGKTSNDILKVGEALKQAVEAQLDNVMAEATVAGVADEFFRKLASEIDRWD